ncbi:uncharacterized protein LOC110723339 [Chenopodium quinoa]|uniref:uncharacterized protein LOC110723339 n=1 Tax=Chenopodium quinoa TaxID=63459 RepID=UPI000B79845C|nr:uncharacterized protein LOC110723339 [Chenopodium quinoa]
MVTITITIKGTNGNQNQYYQGGSSNNWNNWNNNGNRGFNNQNANSIVRGPRAQQDNYYTQAPPQKSSLEEMMESEAKMFNTFMATSDKFLKDIVSGRRSCDVVETVNLTESCSAIIMNKMPPKLGDPGNFSIPCAINRMQIDNALCDLGASVSLMPYTVYQRLDIGELLPANITLQLADRSIKFPKGKVEDVPLRVGKFVIPIDIVVLDMDEDKHIPIILGRPFLATSSALISVKSAKITLKVGEEVLEFDLNASMKYPNSTLEKCMKIDTID